jgi:hypothetical protein
LPSDSSQSRGKLADKGRQSSGYEHSRSARLNDRTHLRPAGVDPRTLPRDEPNSSKAH